MQNVLYNILYQASGSAGATKYVTPATIPASCTKLVNTILQAETSDCTIVAVCNIAYNSCLRTKLCQLDPINSYMLQPTSRTGKHTNMPTITQLKQAYRTVDSDIKEELSGSLYIDMLAGICLQILRLYCKGV